MKSNESYIPFHRASIGEEERNAVLEVLDSGWLTTGPATQQFEREFKNYIGCRHALAVNSGTAALQLALDTLGLRPGDEVLVPSYTFTATAEVVTYFGGKPILCDSLPGEFNLSPADAESRITDHTRAVIAVHIAGQVCEMDAIHDLASRYGLHVIEDAAHALPATFHGNRVGTTSSLTAFSFYATKTITTGEGGMLTTDRDDYAERTSRMRLHGIGGNAWKRYSPAGSWFYEVTEAGYKLNLCDILGAIGLAQLRKANAFWQRRKEIADRYTEILAQVEELQVPPTGAPGDQHGWHLYILRLRKDSLSITRDDFIENLKQAGVGTSVHFIPLHRHPYYQNSYGYSKNNFPNAEDSYLRCLSLPIYPDMSDGDVERVIRSVQQVVTNHLKVRVRAA